MNEAINLDEVKRHIQCCIDTEECLFCSFFREGCDKITFAKLMMEAVRQLEAQVPKWISVEERLPKRNARVVVTDGKHTWDYGQFNGLAFCFNNENPNPRKWNWKKHAVRHVEWWMPKETALPESPKETEHD